MYVDLKLKKTKKQLTLTGVVTTAYVLTLSRCMSSPNAALRCSHWGLPEIHALCKTQICVLHTFFCIMTINVRLCFVTDLCQKVHLKCFVGRNV